MKIECPSCDENCENISTTQKVCCVEIYIHPYIRPIKEMMKWEDMCGTCQERMKMIDERVIK